MRVNAAAICGSDVRIVGGRKTRDVRVGHPIGHECAGTVAAGQGKSMRHQNHTRVSYRRRLC
ncbi:MAG: alcohol dehydrogenase catalytic domain-containing protein [Planctomycetota bacterium]